MWGFDIIESVGAISDGIENQSIILLLGYFFYLLGEFFVSLSFFLWVYFFVNVTLLCEFQIFLALNYGFLGVNCCFLLGYFCIIFLLVIV